MHLPGTLLNDQFDNGMSIADALDTIAEREPQISVIGVTDYVTTRTFREAVAAAEHGAGQGIDLIFPNVELRLHVPTTTGSAVNLHLMCAPDHVDELERFVAGLEYEYANTPHRATVDDLVRLGRTYRNEPDLDRDAALREGANQFKVDFEKLSDRMGRDGWAREHCLVGVAGGTSDGTSGIRTPDGSFASQREKINRLAHIIFSGSPQQRSYWLGENADDLDEMTRKYGGRRLCLHGSDSHTSARLGAPDLNRHTWLKGDPSFDTLLQAVIEPQARAEIGELSPGDASATRRLAEIVVAEGSGWFVEKSLAINPGLVAIIGARGSGKTALADLIAAGAGSTQPFENGRSFIRRAGPLIDDAVAAVTWSDDATDVNRLDNPPVSEWDAPPAVRYLSQQFVDKLCAADGVSEELLSEIERVVFDTWDLVDNLGASDFKELLERRCARAVARQQTEHQRIAEVSVDINTHLQLKYAAPTLVKERDELLKELTKAATETAALTSQIDPRVAAQLKRLTDAYTAQNAELQLRTRRHLSLKELASQVDNERNANFTTTTQRLRTNHEEAGLSPADWSAFAVDFVGNVDDLVGQRIAVAEAQVSALRGSMTEAEIEAAKSTTADELDALGDVSKITVAHLDALLSGVKARSGLNDTRSARLTLLQTTSAKRQGRIDKLNAQIAAAGDVDTQVAELRATRQAHYVAYFDALLEQERELNELYAPLSDTMANAGPSVAKLKFTVARTVDLAGWARRGEALLDLRKSGPFYGRGALLDVASRELLPAWESGTPQQIAEAVSAFVTAHAVAIRDHTNVERSEESEYREWTVAVSAWLYNSEHVTLSYSLAFDGVDIELLSPGTRGIVLLLLYLAVDTNESIPLIIDQPEENLDPESVYTELVQLFREASQRRQVIMVTHNANLVVNSEVDQVIVASCDTQQVGRLPKLRYESGGLENPAIRAAVCNILEGGEAAFRERARRLRVELGT